MFLSCRYILKISQDKQIYVQGLSKVPVKSVDEIYQKLEKGSEKRHVAGHDENSKSSRSHAIFIVTVESSFTGADGVNVSNHFLAEN